MESIESKRVGTVIDVKDVVSIRVIRKCPKCGRDLYRKLGDCGGNIALQCPKCRNWVNINLALRTAR